MKDLVAQSQPAYLAQYAPLPTDIDLSTVRIPMLKAGQYTSQEVKDGVVKFGEIYSTLGETFGTEMDIIIVKPFINYVKFEMGKGMIGRSKNSSVWEEGALRGTPIDKEDLFPCIRYNFYVITTTQKDPIPYLLSMYSSSGGKEGKNLFDRLAISMVKKGIPCFAQAYKITTVKDKNDKGDFAAWKVINIPGFVSEESAKLAAMCRENIDKRQHEIVEDIAPVDNATVTTTATNPGF